MYLKVKSDGTWIGELGTRLAEPTRRENAHGSPTREPGRSSASLGESTRLVDPCAVRFHLYYSCCKRERLTLEGDNLKSEKKDTGFQQES